MTNTTTQTKHTPGPWIHNQGSPVVHADGQFIAQVARYCQVSEQLIVQEGNANLIAAAPDLLKEMEAIAAGWREIKAGRVPGRKLSDWEEERLEFALQTIAKAEGGA